MKALIITILTTGVLQLANLASGLLAARLLLPEGRGELAIAILWPTTLAYLLLFGLSDAVLYYSANRQGGRPQDRDRELAAALGQQQPGRQQPARQVGELEHARGQNRDDQGFHGSACMAGCCSAFFTH